MYARYQRRVVSFVKARERFELPVQPIEEQRFVR